jgi:Putative restriction endonuclease
MVATPPIPSPQVLTPIITWEKLPDDYVLPDDPVDNIYQPLLAEGLRDGLETLGLTTQSLLSTNYGICATVDGKIVVKAPDWAFIPQISVPRDQVNRSYTPNLQGDSPVVVMEFLSEADGGEYSAKPTYPYGKWFFYEQVLAVPNYVIFDIEGGLLEFYRLTAGRYVLEQPNPDGRHWIEEMGLFLGTWQGERAGWQGYWLRWWTAAGEMLPWVIERAAQAETKAQAAEILAAQERGRAEKLAELLRAQGIDPDSVA